MQSYFSHDVFTRENLKIKRLISAHKMEGYGIFWAVVEFLHNNGNKLMLDELDIIANDLGVDVNLVEAVVKNFKLFTIRKNVISSARVAQNIKIKNEKSQRAKMSAMQRWSVFTPDANALQTQCECNAINKMKEDESKEKKIKENESKEDESKKKEIKNEKKEKNQKNTTDKVQNQTSDKGLSAKNAEILASDTHQVSDFYGISNNVHLTASQYDSLVMLYGKDVTDIVISELSHKIAVGKEKAYSADIPDAHLARLERYARQKIATTGTAGRANVNLTRNTSPAGAAEPRKAECEALKHAREIVEGGGVPPPPEFHEAGKRLRKELKGDNS